MPYRTAVDNSTIEMSGGKAQVKDQSLTQTKMAAAATQTVSDSGFVLQHNDKSVLQVTADGDFLAVLASDATTPIAAGTVAGQLLCIQYLSFGPACTLVIQNAGNTKLGGDWNSMAERNGLLVVMWDGTYWVEVSRVSAFNPQADGMGAVILGGQNSRATGEYATVVGANTGTASGDASVVIGGLGAMASADRSVAMGGLASAKYAVAFGNQSPGVHWAGISYGDKIGSSAYKTCCFLLQVGDWITHTDANWHELFLDAAGLERMLIPTGGVWTFDILLTGAKTGGAAKVFGFHINGVIKNAAGTTTLLASNVTTLYDADDTDFDAQVAADDTNDALIVQVKDATSGGDVVMWNASVRIAQCAGA